MRNRPVKWPGGHALTWLWHLFFAQKETRCCRYSVARLQWSTGHSSTVEWEEEEGAVVSAVFYYITANGTKSNLTTFLGEKALCVSECYHFLEQCELWTRTSCVWTTAARRSGTLLLICNGGDVSVGLLSEAKGWTFLLVNMLTVAWLWKRIQQRWFNATSS